MRQMSKTKTILKVSDYFSQNIGPFFMIHVYTLLYTRNQTLQAWFQNLKYGGGMETKSYN